MSGEINHSDVNVPVLEQEAFKEIKPEDGMTVEEAKKFWENFFTNNENLNCLTPIENDNVDSSDVSADINKNSTDMTVEEAKEFWKEIFSKEIIPIREDDMGPDAEPAKEYPRQEVIDGVSYYYDDNDNLYRIGNELQPNTTYEMNGYKYQTDDQSRIISAEGTLRIKDREGRLSIKDSIEDIGKGDERETDDRGHLIGDQFDGSNGLENMIPQDANINRNDYKKFENQLAKEVKDGKEVKVKVEPIYESDSRRPDAIAVTYSIDGEENVRIFPN